MVSLKGYVFSYKAYFTLYIFYYIVFFKLLFSSKNLKVY